MDRALDYINGRHANLGAQLNRLESTVVNLTDSAEALTTRRRVVSHSRPTDFH
jgi:flagellin-like hook-associated protein FlgL